MFNLKRVSLVLLALFVLMVPVVALAGQEKLDESIYIAADEIIEGNFINVAGVIEINGAVNGDVIVAGNSITITGPVAGDVIAVGSNVRILGLVQGSVRAAGSNVEIAGEVEKNVWAAGSSVLINESAKVAWDVWAAGATVDVKAPVGRSVWLTGASVILNNSIGQDAKIAVDEKGQIVLNPATVIEGDLEYKVVNSDSLDIKEGAEVKGEKIESTYDKSYASEVQNFFNIVHLFILVIGIFSLLVVGLVFVTLVPKVTMRVYEEMIKRPWPSIGWGVIFLIVVPIISLFLMVTIIGLPLGLILIPLYFVVIYVAKVLAGFAIGLWLLNKINKENKYKGSLIVPLIVGVTIYLFVGSIPIIGFIFKCIAMLWALGALLTIKREIWREYR